MAFIALTTAETDAKSPIDDRLWEKVKDNFDDLDSRVVLAGAVPYVFEVMGRLSDLSYLKRSIASTILNEEYTPSRCRYSQKLSGTSGTLAFDIRKHTSPRTPITEIAHQYTALTSSISRATSGLATQSVARWVPQISTQSIAYAEAAVNVSSIILLGSNLVLYNLASSIATNLLVGDSVLFAGCTNGANNGAFVIVEIGQGGGNNVVITNASGVAQTGAAGTVQSKIMSYNFTNPVDTAYAAGRAHTFASHTTGANNGTLTIYAINQSGNNIWVKNATGATQAGVAGTVDSNYWRYNFSGAAPADFVVGETIFATGHTSALNDGSAMIIIAANSGGNNLILYNTAGVVQGGVAGTVHTERFAYNMPSDPSTLNDGTFTVKQVTASAVVILNSAGITQGASGGTLYTTKKLVKFSSDQSANYTTDSYIEMKDCVSEFYNYRDVFAPHRVVQVNRGGGANYNVVIDITDAVRVSAPAQSSPAGYVQTEMKSIFDTASPTLAADVSGLEPNQNIVGTSVDLLADAIPAQTPLMLYVTEVQAGDPRDLTVSLR